MAGPWEQYAAPAAPAARKPWEEYGAPAAAAPRAPAPMRPDQVANKAILDQWRAEGSPQLTTAPKTDAEYKRVRAVMDALNVEKEQGRPAPEIPVAQQRKATQADIDNAERLRLEGTLPPNRDGIAGRMLGGVESIATVGSGMANTVLGNLYGIGKAAANGKYGTQEGVQEAKKTSEEYVAQNTYSPRSDTGKAGVQQIAAMAKPLEGLMGVTPVDMGMMLGAARAGVQGVRGLATANAAAQNADDVAQVAGNTSRLRDLVRPPAGPRPGSVGAARTAEETARVVAADSLPVPLGSKLTRGMRTRKKEDLAFENMAAKNPEAGAPLRNRTVELNQGILDNFDAFAEMTGSQGYGLREAGKVVDKVLVERVGKVKNEIRQAYNEAAKSVEGKTPADTKPLRDFIEKHAAEADTGNAPVINAVKRSLEKLDPDGTGVIPLKDFNEIREMVGRIAKDGTPNAVYRKPLQTLVDDAVEANGGPLYRTARRQYENYQNEFKNAAAIDKMLRMKPGTKDRAVAYEDMVDHAILKAQSLDDVRNVRNTLTKAGPEGEQAWRELQGEAVRQIKERVSTASALNEAGQREVSAAAFDKIIREMDADGRLDFVFTKKGAQQMRDLNDLSLQVKTMPVGTVSSSGTAEVILAAMDTIASGFVGLPLPVGTTVNYALKRAKKKALVKRVDKAVNPDGAPTP